MSTLTRVRASVAALLSTFVDTVESALSRMGRGTRWIVVEGEDGKFSVFRISGGRPSPIGDAGGWDDAQRTKFAKQVRGSVELRLAATTMVTTVLKVPGEALPFLKDVIEHRLEKLTPWRPDKLIYGYHAAARPGADNHYEVLFSATSREIASAAEARLRQTGGVAASAIGCASEPLNRPLCVDLFNGTKDEQRKRRRGRIATVTLAGMVISFGALVWSQWFDLRVSDERAKVIDKLTEARQRLVAGSSTDPKRQRDEALLRSKVPQSATFLLIDRLAKAVPDDTVLDELEVKPSSVRIAGNSSDTSGLISLLETDVSLTNAQFGAPVTRQPDGRDHFDIVLSRGPLREPGSAQ